MKDILEVSPLLADNADGTIKAAVGLHALAKEDRG